MVTATPTNGKKASGITEGNRTKLRQTAAEARQRHLEMESRFPRGVAVVAPVGRHIVMTIERDGNYSWAPVVAFQTEQVTTFVPPAGTPPPTKTPATIDGYQREGWICTGHESITRPVVLNYGKLQAVDLGHFADFTREVYRCDWNEADDAKMFASLAAQRENVFRSREGAA